jgi:hypothetical protein
MGRQAEMTPRELRDGGPVPPENTDSVSKVFSSSMKENLLRFKVRVVRVCKDGSKVDVDDNIVYDGDALRLVYLISYE